VVSFEGLPETTYFFVLMVRFSFIEGVFWLESILYKQPVPIMKEIGHLHYEPPAQPVLVVSVVSVLGLREMAYFLY
jgi:hypothetical protein